MRTFIMSLLLLCCSARALAAPQVIELSDGSRIRGEVVSLEGGVYTIVTETLGTITLRSSQIVNIGQQVALPATPPSPASGALTPASGALQSIQANIASNPSLMAQILRLQTDPAMQAVLSDPEIMRAVQSFDFEALANNPKIKALMENPTMQQIESGLSR